MTLINPFRPNKLVGPGMFAGRAGILDSLDGQLLQTRAGNPQNFLIVGERGIGKTSLLQYVKFIAQGKVRLRGTKLNFLVVELEIEKSTTQFDLMRRIHAHVRQELAKTEKAKKYLEDVWGLVQRVEVGGFGFRDGGKVVTSAELMDQFYSSLAEVESKVTDKKSGTKLFNASYDGILILIDEADNASKELDIGAFLKLLWEKLQRAGAKHVMFGLSGLDSLREVLISSHPSSLRMFEIYQLDKLNSDEIGEVIDKTLQESKNLNHVETRITEEARNALVYYSEGYPHFIQQFGSSAFAVAMGNTISGKDVAKGAFGPDGAIAKIGETYYRDDFYNNLEEESRQVLRLMAEISGDWISKKQIRDTFVGKSQVLDKALDNLQKSGLIKLKEDEKEIYRLRQKAFAHWIKLIANQAAQDI